MSSSITKFVDETVRTLLYTKFGDLLGIDDGVDSQVDKINKGVIQYPKETALRSIAEKRGEDFLEFINFWRRTTSPAWDRQRTAIARRGVWLTTVDANRLSAINVKAQPVDLEYDVWFWSKDLDKVYQCIERYIFWQQDYPKIDLTYSFDDGHSFNYSPEVHLSEIVDESTAPIEYDHGLMFVYRMPIRVDAWILSGYTFKTITKIRLTIYDKDSVTSYSEIVVDGPEKNTELEGVLRMGRETLYGIESVSTTTNSVTVANDRHEDFSVGDRVRIEGSTDNDESYVINSVSVVNDNTVLVLTGALTSTTADGALYKIG